MELRQGAIGIMVAAARVVASGSFSGTRIGFSGTGAVLALSVYTLTLAEGLTFANAAVALTIHGTAPARAIAESVLDLPNQIKISTFDAAGAAADFGFEIAIFRRSVGQT